MPTATRSVAASITGRRILVSRFDDESALCSGFEARRRCKNSAQFMLRSTTISIRSAPVVSLAEPVDAYNFARRLKTLRGFTPYEFVCKTWTSPPERFKVSPLQQMPGLTLDRIEVGRVFGKEQKARPGGLDGRAHRLSLVRPEIVEKPEGKSAKHDRRIDHGIAGRNHPKHGENDDEPRRHADEQRPGNRLADSFDEELAPRQHLGHPSLEKAGDGAVVVVRRIELANCDVDVEKQCPERFAFDAHGVLNVG